MTPSASSPSVGATALPKVVAEPGHLPPAWDRPVVFFANLTSLFFGNRVAANALREMLSCTLASYGGRLAPVLDLLFHSRADEPNLLVADRAPDAALMAYQRDTLGLVLPDLLVATAEDYEAGFVIDQIRDHPSGWLDGFVTDDQLARIAGVTHMRTYSTPEGSRRANDKLELHEELVRLGLPTFDTEIARSPGEIAGCCARLAAKGYRSVAIKTPIGASGIGIIKSETRDPERVSDMMFYDGACLVQGWIEPGINAVRHIHSPSVQLFVGDDSVSLFDITDQILDHHSVHEGNLAPPHAPGSLPEEYLELLRQAEPIGQWLFATGYRGPASIDFHVARHGDVVDARACEVNARVTGATYPSLLARHFQRNGAWLMRNLALPEPLSAAEVLRVLDRAGGLFRPGAGRGCIPINFNTDDAGATVKGQFLFLAPDVDDVAAQLNELVALPEIDLHYDRD